MKPFLKRFALVALIPMGILLVYNALGLALMEYKYPYPRYGAATYLKHDSMRRGTKLLVGCSNLKHNINPYQLWETHPEVDIFHSAAVANSTFMRFVGSLSPFNMYDTIIYYAPYHYIKKSIAIREGKKICEYITCGEYALQTIKNNPINFFNNWLYNYYAINSQCRSNSTSSLFYNSVDTYMNRMRTVPAYSAGKLPFIHNKHIIEPVLFDEKDAIHMESIFPNKVVYIVFSPIPNISENTAFIDDCIATSTVLKRRLNEPFIADSSLFFDQWYHMNGIGAKQETERMSLHLDTIARCH